MKSTGTESNTEMMNTKYKNKIKKNFVIRRKQKRLKNIDWRKDKSNL